MIYQIFQPYSGAFSASQLAEVDYLSLHLSKKHHYSIGHEPVLVYVYPNFSCEVCVYEANKKIKILNSKFTDKIVVLYAGKMPPASLYTNNTIYLKDIGKDLDKMPYDIVNVGIFYYSSGQLQWHFIVKNASDANKITDLFP